MTQTLVLGTPEENMVIAARAAEILRSGGLVVYPTDTIYGLACDPRIEESVQRLLDVKHRSSSVGLPLLFANMAQCEQYHIFGELEKILVTLFWPGALTLVVRLKKPLSPLLTGAHDTVAIRIPNHIVPCEIARHLDSPIVGTSANISGGATPFEVSTAKAQLGDDVDLYIDGGPSKATASSTIVGIDSGPPSSIIVYREGQITVKQLIAELQVQPHVMQLWSSRIVYSDL